MGHKTLLEGFPLLAGAPGLQGAETNPSPHPRCGNPEAVYELSPSPSLPVGISPEAKGP